MFSLQITVMALEIAVEDPAYENIAIQSYSQFLAIANTIAGHTGAGVSLWDNVDGFFKDLVVEPNGDIHRIDVFSWVGIIPLFACEVVDARLLANRKRFNALLWEHKGGMFDGSVICACPVDTNERGEHLLSLVTPSMFVKMLPRIFDEEEFFSPYGVRSVSKRHAAGTKSGPYSWHRQGRYSLCARRIRIWTLRRQFQLARTGMDANQLFTGSGY